ncbi:hypothetical protein CYLTODRAFT_238490 [Cylindrobasidium torrendii FP15055 ss-10]|uniref:Uncharacterized protein n=1 Tax=Cylindrobasidium torrendii FP15055 ss-10 TaxID=1314674 RepID=A0A0D7BUM3_9AGAR|nr:hypothetical protein CYLTODRAFT_238490 [Cylindrobasidium torrendii FP15055 ss-10]
MFNHIPGPIRELALVNFMSDRNYLPHPSDAFAAVSSLEIVMNDIFEFMTPEHWEPKYDDIWYSDVALAFFSVFKNSLRSLTLESYDECPIFSGHPFDMIFPHLEEIRLEHYPFVVVPNPTWLGLKTATLNSFLLAHKSTLKTLFLLNCPALFDDRWPFGSRVPSLSTVYDNLREELVELDVLKVRFHPLSVSFKEDKWVGERFEDFGAASTDIQRDLEAAVRWEAQVEQKRKSWL